jgi:hypothetical protein
MMCGSPRPLKRPGFEARRPRHCSTRHGWTTWHCLRVRLAVTGFWIRKESGEWRVVRFDVGK